MTKNGTSQRLENSDIKFSESGFPAQYKQPRTQRGTIYLLLPLQQETNRALDPCNLVLCGPAHVVFQYDFQLGEGFEDKNYRSEAYTHIQFKRPEKQCLEFATLLPSPQHGSNRRYWGWGGEKLISGAELQHSNPNRCLQDKELRSWLSESKRDQLAHRHKHQITIYTSKQVLI